MNSLVHKVWVKMILVAISACIALLTQEVDLNKLCEYINHILYTFHTLKEFGQTSLEISL